MNSTRLRCILVRVIALGLVLPTSLVIVPPWARAQSQARPAPIASISVFATGLNNPRGLHFGPDGQLYVAEGGLGGRQSTVGRCQQVPPPIGPYTGGFSARISRIDRHGKRVTLIDHLPSSQTSPASESTVSGVSDLAFIGHTLYGLLAGAGCSHGIPQVPNAIFRFEPEHHRVFYIADLSHFLQTHPVKHPDQEDFEPDGTWYSMVAVNGSLYALEPNHGELDRITPRWQRARHAGSEIQRVADISASQGHIVPTAVVFHRGLFYVANLGTFPVHVGTEKLLVITPRGHVRVLMSGLTAVLGLAFDRRGRLYVLETTTANNAGPVPGTGVIVRVSERGRQVLIASGLSFPTAMTFGPDGDLYVSNKGFGYGPGQGEILRIHLAEH